MIKIMFVCYGNICRSPMAEFLFKNMLKEKGLLDKAVVSSSATSTEELNSPVHYGTRKILQRLNIDCANKRATQLLDSHYNQYDYFVGMDQRNRRAMQRILGQDSQNKICILPDFSKQVVEIADPYWTGDFEQTYIDILSCLQGFYNFLKNNGEI